MKIGLTRLVITGGLSLIILIIRKIKMPNLMYYLIVPFVLFKTTRNVSESIVVLWDYLAQ